MSELTVQTLREHAAEGLAELLPAAVQIGERAGVILRQIDPVWVELYHAAQIVRVNAETLDFEPVTEPAAQAAALAEAVEALTICRRVAFEYEAEQRQLHIEQLAAIRQYAIDRHEAGDICQGGLQNFLATFGMEPYCPRLRVDYTICGSYEVGHRDAAFIENDARDYLCGRSCNSSDIGSSSPNLPGLRGPTGEGAEAGELLSRMTLPRCRFSPRARWTRHADDERIRPPSPGGRRAPDVPLRERRHLRPDLTELDDVDHDSSIYAVTAIDVTVA